jgi:quercetin dioxygenase-like cupin family protein
MAYRNAVASGPERFNPVLQAAGAHMGTVVFVPAGEARRIKADTRPVDVHVVSPPPTEKDHFQVMAKLKQENWQ